jgi:hypothetical protein
MTQDRHVDIESNSAVPFRAFLHRRPVAFIFRVKRRIKLLHSPRSLSISKFHHSSCDP